MNNGTTRLIVMVIDGYSGETTSDLPLLKYVNLDLRAKVLPQEMGRGAASYPGPDHRWNTDDSEPMTERGVKSVLLGSEIHLKTNDHKSYRIVYIIVRHRVFKDMASMQMVIYVTNG